MGRRFGARVAASGWLLHTEDVTGPSDFGPSNSATNYLGSVDRAPTESDVAPDGSDRPTRPGSPDGSDRPASPGLRSAVIYNPVKVADLELLRRTLHADLAAAGWPAPSWHETTAADPGYGQAQAAIQAGAQLIFVSGGDGTVRAAVTALVGTDVALAVLPAGTGNLLASNFGLTDDVAAGVRVALAGARQLIDVGQVSASDPAGAGEQCFAVLAGMGFDAQMIEGTSELAKKHLGWLAYLGGGVKHLLGRPMRVQVVLDGGTPMHLRARAVLVGNVGRLPGGLQLLRRAQPDDGKLDVAILNPNNLRHWALMFWALLRRHKRVPLMSTYRAERVEIRSDRSQPRQLDGDLIEPSAQLVIELRAKSLLLCVPFSEGG